VTDRYPARGSASGTLQPCPARHVRRGLSRRQRRPCVRVLLQSPRPTLDEQNAESVASTGVLIRAGATAAVHVTSVAHRVLPRHRLVPEEKQPTGDGAREFVDRRRSSDAGGHSMVKVSSQVTGATSCAREPTKQARVVGAS
jgi:hypothetical protein